MSKIKILFLVMMTGALISCYGPTGPKEMCVIEISTMYSETLLQYPGMCFAFVVDGNNNILDAKTNDQGKYTIIIPEPMFEGREYWIIFYAKTRIEDTRDKGKKFISFPKDEVIEFLY